MPPTLLPTFWHTPSFDTVPRSYSSLVLLLFTFRGQKGPFFFCSPRTHVVCPYFIIIFHPPFLTTTIITFITFVLSALSRPYTLTTLITFIRPQQVHQPNIINGQGVQPFQYYRSATYAIAHLFRYFISIIIYRCIHIQKQKNPMLTFTLKYK